MTPTLTGCQLAFWESPETLMAHASRPEHRAIERWAAAGNTKVSALPMLPAEPMGYVTRAREVKPMEEPKTDPGEIDVQALLSRLSIGGADADGVRFAEYAGRPWVLMLSNRKSKEQATEVVHALHDDPLTIDIPVVQVSHMAKVPRFARRKARKDVAKGVGRQYAYLVSQLEKFGMSTENAALPVGLDWNGELTGPLGFGDENPRAFLAMVRPDGTLLRVEGLGALLIALREEAGTDTSEPVTLVVTVGPKLGERIEVRTEMTIGRREDCDVTIDDPEISGRHATVKPSGPGLVVEDLGSTNGTRVNGTRITAPATVGNNATITLGTTTVRVESRDGGFQQTRISRIPDPNAATRVRRVPNQGS
jgi:hypothetical protein